VVVGCVFWETLSSSSFSLAFLGVFEFVSSEDFKGELGGEATVGEVSVSIEDVSEVVFCAEEVEEVAGATEAPVEVKISFPAWNI